MKTKKIFYFLLLLGFLSGCDYLDIVPDNLPTLEMAFNNKSSAERFLFTCYSFVPEHGKIGTDPGMDVGDEVWYYSDNSADYSNKTTFWIAKGMNHWLIIGMGHNGGKLCLLGYVIVMFLLRI